MSCTMCAETTEKKTPGFLETENNSELQTCHFGIRRRYFDEARIVVRQQF